MTQSVQTAPKLHDIPLTSSDETGGDTLADVDVQKVASRGNSLKRLFKITQKRAGDTRSENGPTMLEVVNRGDKDVEEDPAEMPEKEKVRDVTRRFQMRLGNMPRDPEEVSMKSSTSKSTLKDSLSNYWNTVFKRSSKKNKNKSNANAANTGDGLPDSTTAEPTNDADLDDDDDEETNETEISSEEVHTLAISDEIAAGSADGEEEQQQQAEYEDEGASSEK